VIGVVAGFIWIHPMYTAHWPIVNDIASYVMLGGLAGLGFSAKDSTNHSTSAEVNIATQDAATAAKGQ
jgi:hypothetical protein